VVQTVILLHLAVLARADSKTPLPPSSQLVRMAAMTPTPWMMVFFTTQDYAKDTRRIIPSAAATTTTTVVVF